MELVISMQETRHFSMLSFPACTRCQDRGDISLLMGLKHAGQPGSCVYVYIFAAIERQVYQLENLKSPLENNINDIGKKAEEEKVEIL
jgi:hypothetical protein